MSKNFDFVAPQFLESLPEAANLAEQDGADSFFDTASSTPIKSISPKQETFHTPFGGVEKETENLNTDDEKENDNIVNECIENQVLQNNEQEVKKAKRLLIKQSNQSGILGSEEVVAPIDVCHNKTHGMMTRLDVTKSPSLEVRSRQIIREDLKRKASPDTHYSKRHASKYMSLAEKILHFQVDTPPRFKSKTVPQEEKKVNIHLKPTIPNSPKLITKMRARLHETESPAKQDTFVFKANELNSKIFDKPDDSARPKPKPSTVFKPFKLTEVQKKEPHKEEVFQFKAKPAPKWLGSTDSLNCSVISNCSRRSRRNRGVPCNVDEAMMVDDAAYGGMSLVSKTNTATEIKPFSFDERDKELLKKKDEKIKKMQEEAVKKPVFLATPAPSFIAKPSHHTSISSETLSTSVISEVGSVKESTKHESHGVNNTFKANLPTVLFKEPFIPQKSNRPALEPLKIELNTERRARERFEFDKELSLKNERLEEERRKVMEVLEQDEHRQIKELRKQLVHKALPVPKCITEAKKY